jgi:methionine aminopeptidase
MTRRPEEIALLAESGKLLADVFGYLDQLSLIGMSTMQVNDLVDRFIVDELNARPASKGQYGFAYALKMLREGMVFTIEPMINQGRAAVRTEDDGWTVVTCDGQLSAQFEHTVAVTSDGVRVLTLRCGETMRS